MRQLQAHLVLGLFDLAALVSAFFVFSRFRSLGLAIEQGVPEISYYSALGFILLFLVVPITHAVSLIELTTNLVEANRRFFNGLLIAAFLSLAGFGFLLNSSLKSKLASYSYHHCEQSSSRMTFANSNLYVRYTDACPSTN